MFRQGQQIGPYMLIREIGRGAFGVVWLCEQRTAVVTTHFAAKLPLSEDIDIAEFRKEAQIWVHAGGHPNLLPLITADVYSGQVLIASQYASEGTLSSWLRQHGNRAPSVDSAVQMVIGILKGLRHLHDKNIVHRDLKTGNVLLQAQEPLIADFGLARILKTESSTYRHAGTPAYMSPEVWESNDRCFQADLWAVGVILYEMLSGRRPFTAPDRVRLEQAIRTEVPHPLPDDIPQDIRLLVFKTLEKKKGQRYQSADEMLQALDAFRLRRPAMQQPSSDTIPQTTRPFSPLGSSDGVLLGIAVDLSGSMKSSINNRDITGISRLEAFRSSLERMINNAEEKLRKDHRTVTPRQPRLEAFVYGFGLRLLPHCDLLALLQVVESPEAKQAVDSIKNRLARQARQRYSGYSGIADIARGWGLGNYIDAAAASAEMHIREQIFGELRPLLERQLGVVGDVTVDLADFSSRWRSSGASFKEAEQALFGDTPMCSALHAISKRFERELAIRHEVMPILFLLSDGEATDGDPASLCDPVKAMNGTVVSCFVGGHDTANPRVLFGSEQEGWDRGVKQMFQLASPVPPNSVFSTFLIQQGWEIQPSARLFVQANHSDVLEEFMNVVLSPLGSGYYSTLAPPGQ